MGWDTTNFTKRSPQREILDVAFGFTFNGNSTPLQADNIGYSANASGGAGIQVTRLGVGQYRLTLPHKWGQILSVALSQFKGNGTATPWCASIYNIDQATKRIDLTYYEESAGTMTAVDPAHNTSTRLMANIVVQRSMVNP